MSFMSAIFDGSFGIASGKNVASASMKKAANTIIQSSVANCFKKFFIFK